MQTHIFIGLRRNNVEATEPHIAPLLTALEFGAASCHPWKAMQSVCIRLMEHYGSGSLKTADGLKLAVSYLQAAIKLNNQRLLVTRDPLGLLSDKSLQGPCIEELAVIMSAAANKSNNNTTTGGKNAQFGNDGLVSGRDALALFSSLIRESDPLWLDGFEYDLQMDLHAALKKLSSGYASQCCLQQLPSKSVPPVVASNSLFVLWNPTVSSSNSSNNKTHLQTANTNVTSSVTDGTENKNQKNDESLLGVYNYYNGYFLLGVPVISSADDSKSKAIKATKNQPTSVEGEPVLMRVQLSKSSLKELEEDLIHLLNDFKQSGIRNSLNATSSSNHNNAATGATLEDSNAINNNVAIKDVLNKFVVMMMRIYNLVKVIKPEEPETEGHGEYVPTTEVINENGAYVVKINLSEDISCTISANESTVGKLSEIFSVVKFADGVIDGPLCLFFRALWGFE